MNGKLLQCLPEGASLPPGWEREKKEVLMNKKNKKKGESSDSSSSSESSVESGSEDVVIPGAIDNTSLMLERNNSWLVPPLDVSINNHGSNSNSSDNGESEENVPLKSNLVRGHHFEILPREAYAALISWYGEVSTPILRRVQSIDELPWIASNDKQNRNGLSVRLALYGDRWDVTAVNSSNRDYNGNFFCCCACRAPYAKSKCTKCKCARYCSKDCQKVSVDCYGVFVSYEYSMINVHTMSILVLTNAIFSIQSHWPYHKNHCWSLMKQKFQNEALAAKKALVPEMNVWGRVGLNNLGNTCFMSAAVQVGELSCSFTNNDVWFRANPFLMLPLLKHTNH
jgi:ubiquitin carboxyl-terminal hydrolase 4/11/15